MSRCKKDKYIFSCLYSMLIICVTILLVPSVSLAQDEYPPLQKVLEEFPKPGSGLVTIYPYEHRMKEKNVDGSKFSIYIPAGCRTVYLTLGANKETTLSAKSQIREIGSFTQKFGYGGNGSYKQVGVLDHSLDTSEWESGKWVFFEFDNNAKPDLYYSIYRDINTDHKFYSKPPANHPTPPDDSTVPEEDESGDDTGGDNDSDYVEPDDTDTTSHKTNWWEYVDSSNRKGLIGSGGDTGDDDEQQDPPVQTQAPELNGITGYQQAMTQVQEVPAAHLDENSYLAPKLNLELDRVPSGNNGQIEAAGYAMLEINGNFYTVVPDVLGNLSLMPIGEVGVRPYCTEVEIDLENSAWYCNAFEIIQDFFAVNNINGIEQLQEWHAQGENIIFYFGFAPGGNLDEFQGAAFQIVR